MLKNVVLHSVATAFASIVLPVPEIVKACKNYTAVSKQTTPVNWALSLSGSLWSDNVIKMFSRTDLEGHRAADLSMEREYR